LITINKTKGFRSSKKPQYTCDCRNSSDPDDLDKHYTTVIDTGAPETIVPKEQ